VALQLKALVTGGAGFIGSALCAELRRRGLEVTCLDNLSTGSLDNVEGLTGDGFQFIEGDCLNEADVTEAVREADIVFHLAADADVSRGQSAPGKMFESNVAATEALLEGVRSTHVKKLVFASSSTVYGEPRVVPTPETYSPLVPISFYGASKLAAEALISGYAESSGFAAVLLRLANVVGPRSRRGIVYDFVQKLIANPEKMEVLGDGRQTKSYLYLEDCVAAMIKVTEEAHGVNVYNVGSEDAISVLEIAKQVAQTMGLNPELSMSGGVDGGRGWSGDIRRMWLDVRKLEATGWRPKYSSREAVERTVVALRPDGRRLAPP
jgi:UDP-glucose 4-epimerase